LNALFLADSIGKSFGPKTVLKSATAWARRGQITVVMGLNGCGKSTLIRCALGLHRADHGMVRFADVTHRRPHLWRLAMDGLFYLPDRGLLSRRLNFGEQLRLLSGRFLTQDLDEILERLEVDALLPRRRREMSGGERRRAELALALARRPSCLIADEPLTEVEPKDRELVAGSLKKLADEGAAVLVTGHEIHDLLDLSDEVIWMAAGTTHGLGPPAAARRHDQFRREYLGQRTE
jgi:ABC-type multidrug transport system ATPase subunit